MTVILILMYSTAIISWIGIIAFIISSIFGEGLKTFYQIATVISVIMCAALMLFKRADDMAIIKKESQICLAKDKYTIKEKQLGKYIKYKEVHYINFSCDTEILYSTKDYNEFKKFEIDKSYKALKVIYKDKSIEYKF